MHRVLFTTGTCVSRVVRLLCVIVALFAPSVSMAQAILVAPQGVVLNNRERTGTVELYNPSTRAAEITIRPVYGHPTTTPDGDLTLSIIEQPDSSDRSAAGFVEAFPRRLVLQPNQRQTIRFLARPPVGLADGEYWARMIISSKDAEQAAGVTRDTTGVTVGLTLEVRTIIAVNYRNGAQRTGVQLGALTTVTTADSLVLRAPMQRIGTAAWIGLTTVRLRTDDGTVVATQTLQTAVYQSMSPRFAFDRTTLTPGRYRISVDLSSDRPDVTQGTLLRAPPQHGEAVITIPAAGR